MMKSQNRTWLTIIVLVRVIITLGIMMILFWGMWIGYFTLPLILIGIFFIILAISDVGILVSLKKEKSGFRKKHKKIPVGDKQRKNNETSLDDS